MLVLQQQNFYLFDLVAHSIFAYPMIKMTKQKNNYTYIHTSLPPGHKDALHSVHQICTAGEHTVLLDERMISEDP